jgi:ATP-dependent DNA ligase
MLIVFDLLVDERGELLTGLPLYKRRPRLERFAERYLTKKERFCLSPATEDRRRARRWLVSAKGGLDGVLAKRLDLAYRSGDRTGMQKIKRLRTAECVIGGFRYAEGEKEIGSLLLGLYDAEGRLDYVGFASGLTRDERRKLVPKLERIVKPPGFTGRAPGGPSRWNRGKNTDWCPLAPKLVVEVRYDHVTNARFRHGTRLLRWRPDKAPAQCTLDQIVPRRRFTAPRAPAPAAAAAAAGGAARGAPRSTAARSRAPGLRVRGGA